MTYEEKLDAIAEERNEHKQVEKYFEQLNLKAENEQLKAQIEKMKHCITCKYYLDWRVDCEEKRDCEPSTMKHWELKE